MKLIETVSGLREWRRRVADVVLVPTMGALHEGHGALVREARRLAGAEAQVVVTIFVNPLQFGPGEDFERYPRTLEADLALCAEGGADVVFAPAISEVYAPDRSVKVLETRLAQVLCGASRPGHFDGVCTVVAKLFNLTQPSTAVFGKKDFQQLAIIRRLVRDLDFPVAICGLETVREADGLAMSSRNRYLSAQERAQAPALRQALLAARTAWQQGQADAQALIRLARSHLEQHAPLGRVDYLSLVDGTSLESRSQADAGCVMAAAFWLGKARLIDNIEFATAV
jgi:pantoate--beta-alanine ligase